MIICFLNLILISVFLINIPLSLSVFNQNYWPHSFGHNQYRKYEKDSFDSRNFFPSPSLSNFGFNLQQNQNDLPYYEYWKYYRYYHPTSIVKPTSLPNSNQYSTSYPNLSFSKSSSNFFSSPSYLNSKVSNSMNNKGFYNSPNYYQNYSYFSASFQPFDISFINNFPSFYPNYPHLSKPSYSNFLNAYNPASRLDSRQFNYNYSHLEPHFKVPNNHFYQSQNHWQPNQFWMPFNKFDFDPIFSRISPNIEDQNSYFLGNSFLNFNHNYEKVRKALVKFKNSSKIKGTVVFFQQENQPVQIKGRITGLLHGLHGMHIHELPFSKNDCTTAGEHYNPQKTNHGAKHDWVRHVGDLGNIYADKNEIVEFDYTDTMISLFNGYSVINRTLVITQDEDNLGRENDLESKKTGKSGSPIACGIIELLKD